MIILILSVILWYLAINRGWLDSVTFVSHVSMMALVFAGISGLASGIAGILALVPTDDLMDAVEETDG